MFNIVGALGSPELRRVKRLMKSIPEKVKHRLEALEALMDPSRNMKKYRDLVAAAVDMPYVPFLPLHLKDLTFVNEVKTTDSNQVVNFDKLRVVGKCISSLVMADFYNLHWNAALQAYIKVSILPPGVTPSQLVGSGKPAKVKSGNAFMGTMRKAARALRDGFGSSDAANISLRSDTDNLLASNAPAGATAAGSHNSTLDTSGEHEQSITPSKRKAVFTNLLASTLAAPLPSNGTAPSPIDPFAPRPAARRYTAVAVAGTANQPAPETSSAKADRAAAADQDVDEENPQVLRRNSLNTPRRRNSLSGARETLHRLSRTISVESLRRLGSSLRGKNKATSPNSTSPGNQSFDKRRRASISLDSIPLALEEEFPDKGTRTSGTANNNASDSEPFASAIGPEGPWSGNDDSALLGRRMSFNERLQRRRNSVGLGSLSQSTPGLDDLAGAPGHDSDLPSSISNRGSATTLDRTNSVSMPQLFKGRAVDSPELMSASVLAGSEPGLTRAQLLAGSCPVPSGIVVTAPGSANNSRMDGVATGDESLMVQGMHSPKMNVHLPPVLSNPPSPTTPALAEASTVTNVSAAVLDESTGSQPQARRISFSAAKLQRTGSHGPVLFGDSSPPSRPSRTSLIDAPSPQAAESTPVPANRLPPALLLLNGIHRQRRGSGDTGSASSLDLRNGDQSMLTATPPGDLIAGRFSPVPRTKKIKLHTHRTTPSKNAHLKMKLAHAGSTELLHRAPGVIQGSPDYFALDQAPDGYTTPPIGRTSPLSNAALSRKSSSAFSDYQGYDSPVPGNHSNDNSHPTFNPTSSGSAPATIIKAPKSRMPVSDTQTPVNSPDGPVTTTRSLLQESFI